MGKNWQTPRRDLSIITKCGRVKLRFDSDWILVWSTGWLLLESKWHIAYMAHFCATQRRALSRLCFQWAQGRRQHILLPKASDTWTLVKAPTFHLWHLWCGWGMFLCCGRTQGAACAAGWPCSWSTPSAPSHKPTRSKHHFPGRSHPPAFTDKWTGQGCWQLLKRWRSVELKYPGVLGNYRTNQPT